MKRFLGLAAAILCALTCMGCGPVFNTEYFFTPPASEVGKTCIMQCEHSRMQCKQMEDMREEQCERNSSYEQERCRDRVYYEKGREPKWHECGSSSSCSADHERCDAMHRSCYQACGGEVRAETRCVANCEELNAMPQSNSAPENPYMQRRVQY